MMLETKQRRGMGIRFALGLLVPLTNKKYLSIMNVPEMTKE
jgi:hypothetical protein